jgi:hypothetical protein
VPQRPVQSGGRNFERVVLRQCGLSELVFLRARRSNRG